MAEVTAHLREGPYDDHVARGEPPLPEHLRVYRCTGCGDIHAEDESEGDWPRGSARYSLVEELVYLWDGGDGVNHACFTSELARMGEPATVGGS